MVVSSATGPTGRWSAPTTVCTVPDYGAGSFTYTATPHPHLGRDGDLVAGYSVSTRDPRPNAYRLRFVRVPAACLRVGGS